MAARNSTRKWRGGATSNFARSWMSLRPTMARSRRRSAAASSWKITTGRRRPGMRSSSIAPAASTATAWRLTAGCFPAARGGPASLRWSGKHSSGSAHSGNHYPFPVTGTHRGRTHRSRVSTLDKPSPSVHSPPA